MRATLDCTAGEIAQVLGWAVATMHHITHSRWAKEGQTLFDLKGWPIDAWIGDCARHD